MVTLKLKPKPDSRGGQRRDEAPSRAPLRGAGSVARKRPTLAQAQAERAERTERERLAAEQDRRDAKAAQRPGRSEPAHGARRDERAQRPQRDERGPPRRAEPGQRTRHDEQIRRPRGDEQAQRSRRDERPLGARSGAPDPRERGTLRGDPRGPAGSPPPRPRRESRVQPPGARDEAAGPGPAHAPRERPTRPAASRSGQRPPDRGSVPNRAFGPAAPPSREQEPLQQRPRRQERRQQETRPQQRSAPAAHSDAPVSAPGSLRLSKYMGELGIASRREADEWIAKGWVRVDGRVVNELGSRVMHGQQVTVDQRAQVQQAQQVTVLINKPVGYVSGQAEDGYEPAYVLVKPENRWADDSADIRYDPRHLRSLVPAGRLDIDSVGLLVLTQNGRIAKQLIGENSKIDKEYLVRVASREGQPLSPEGLALLRHGLELDGVALRPAEVDWINDDQLRFVLREGRKRQIRRMCEAVGLQVLGLKRVRIGRVVLGDLPPGHWRYLRPDEGFT